MIALLLAFAASAVPTQLNHQGRLFDSVGTPLQGSQSVTVRLYDGASGGTPVWEETSSEDFDQGYFQLSLGASSLNPLPELDGSPLWVSVQVGGGAETDRQPVASVPFALRAGTATQVKGGSVDATELVVNGQTIVDSSGTIVGSIDGDTLADLACTNGQLPLFNGSSWGCADQVTGGVVDWGTIVNIPSELLDGDDDTVGNLGCANNQTARYDASQVRWVCHSPSWSDLPDVPAALSDGAVDWSEITGRPAGLDDGDDVFSGSWNDLSDVPVDLSDGTIAWSEISGRPAGLDDGDDVFSGSWSDLSGVPSNLADGTIDWSELTGVSSVLSDGAVDFSELTGVSSVLDRAVGVRPTNGGFQKRGDDRIRARALAKKLLKVAAGTNEGIVIAVGGLLDARAQPKLRLQERRLVRRLDEAGRRAQSVLG